MVKYNREKPLPLNLAEVSTLKELLFSGILTWSHFCYLMWEDTEEEARERKIAVIEDQYQNTDLGRAVYFRNKKEKV